MSRSHANSVRTFAVVAVIASVALGALLGGVLVLLKHRLGWGGPDKDAEDHITLTDR